MKFFINPLSVNEQCNSSSDVSGILAELVDCCTFLKGVALDGVTAILLYDASIENRKFIKDEDFAASLSKVCSKYRDKKLLWYQYVKKSTKISGDLIKTTITSKNTSMPSIVGMITDDKIISKATWLSFEGAELHKEKDFNVAQGLNKFTVQNVHDCNSLKTLLPCYEDNPKHQSKPSISASGEKVAPMPLCNEEAQALLLHSFKDGKDRLAYNKDTKEYYRFKLTHPVKNDKNIYHGFVIQENKISKKLQDKLKK